MSSILVARRLSISLRDFPLRLRLSFSFSFSFSFSTHPSEQTQTRNQKEAPFLAQYLVSSFGFSPDRALKVSSRSNLAAIKSLDRPDSVVRFLSEMGLSDSQIKAVGSCHPNILASSVEKTFEPKVRQLMDAGFSRELLIQLVRQNPPALYLKDTLSRLRFWRDFAGNCDQTLLKIIQRNSSLIQRGLDRSVLPKLNLLNEYGLSKKDLLSLLGSGSRCISCNLDSLKQTLELIEDLGVPRGSRCFLYAVQAVGAYDKDKIQKNAEFFTKTYGWSQEEMFAAFRKHPNVLQYSEEKVKSNMDFLIGKVGFDPSRIALQPWLLGYSVEKVLMPRHTVLTALDAKGLKRKKCSFSSACLMSKRHFYENYVVPFEKDLPGLTEAYVAAGGVKVHA